MNTEIVTIEANNREYNRLITLADKDFNLQAYNSALSNYKSALQIKPDESYPAERISQIELIIDQKQTDDRYRQFLLAADGFFRSNNLEHAKDGYLKALEVKPDEEYPKLQISRIDETLQKLAQRTSSPTIQQPEPVLQTPVTTPVAQQNTTPERTITDASDAYYQSLIALADETFGKNQFNVSRAWYYKALEVKPTEGYPAVRIAEINRILNSMQLSQRDGEYQQFINQGDEAFRNDQLAVARGWYNRALSIRANDDYARSQIAEIQQTINSRLQGGADQVFAEFIKEGDKAFTEKNYSVARVYYQRALQLKPSDGLLREKLEAVRKALFGE